MDRIEALRKIIIEHQAARVQWTDSKGKKHSTLVDAFTASAVVRVHDQLNEANRARLLGLELPAMVSLVWKLIQP